MLQQRRRKLDSEPVKDDSGRRYRPGVNDYSVRSSTIAYSLIDYIKFAFFCMLLIVPIYAIAISAIRHDWLMMIIDALLVPVGFVHGVLLLLGFLN